MDVAFLTVAQGLPLPVLAVLGFSAWASTLTPAARLLAAASGTLLGIRLLLLRPLSRSYDGPGPAFWLSWLADPLAVARIVLSTVRRHRRWRGRSYSARVRTG